MRNPAPNRGYSIPLARSRLMSRVRQKNTLPEVIVRKVAHAMGYRFRLHQGDLPGRPDIIFPVLRKAIFVHGCFWHCHECHLFKWPSSQVDFWHSKILRNRAKDLETRAALEANGWRQLVIWECALKGRQRRSPESVLRTATSWLRSSRRRGEIRGYAHANH